MQTPSVVIIGAGIGGLASALRLAHAGMDVTVLEAQSSPGGKMRTVSSGSGPVDAGPTVLTMRPVFEDLFASAGENLADHITLKPLTTLARHYWADGTTLDLFADRAESAAAVKSSLGGKAAAEFLLFCERAQNLFEAFEAPMMHTEAPTLTGMTKEVLRQPSLIGAMAPHKTLHGLLKSSFTDPKLRQLFGRYATYVGGSPFASPAILSLIWRAEEAGVFAVEGGMHRLAQSIAALAQARGAKFIYDAPATRLVQQGGRITGVETKEDRFSADCVVFNGDPRALEQGLLGTPAEAAVKADQVDPRSLSAHVMAFDAAYAGTELAHHTVFFADDEKTEFGDLAAGKVPRDATLYICAQDHPAPASQRQRFEIIRNAPPMSLADLPHSPEDTARCQTQIMERLARFGLIFSPTPGATALSTPADFDHLFPASQGSLYGRSPHGMLAAFKRPTARTPVPGLYLCGGGTHPGAGVPMATLSGQHAAAAIMTDHALTSTSRPTVTHGGMSTA